MGSADDVRARLEAYAAHPGLLSAEPGHLALDAHLAAGAVALALERHAGTLEELVTPAGRFWVQRGKDLSGVALVIGSGGIFRSSAAGPGAFRAGVRAAAATPCAWPPGPPSWPSTGTTCCGPPACSPPPIPRGPGV